MSSLNDVYHKDPKLGTILEAPTLSAGDKSQIIAELQKHAGGGQDKSDTIKNFLTTLADYNRLGLLKGVCEKFTELMSAAKGEVELTVTSASVSVYLPPAFMKTVLLKSVFTVFGQQDAPKTRDSGLEIAVCGPGQEAQGYKQGTSPLRTFLDRNLRFCRSIVIFLVDLLLRLEIEQLILASQRGLLR
jgi:hypothetical protein